VKKIITFICLGTFCLTFSQEANNQKLTTVLIDLHDKSVANYYINKTKTKAEFSFYLKDYETKIAREKELESLKMVLQLVLVSLHLYSLFIALLLFLQTE
jgi:hypothetical protein